MKSNIKLLILPGWEQNKTHWQAVLDKLCVHIEAEVIELPGFGDEDIISTNWGVPEYSNWLETKIQSIIQKSDQKIILLAHSFGGRVANYFACTNHPVWLNGLILYGAPVIYRPSFKIKVLSFIIKIFKKIIPIYLLPIVWRQKFYSDDYRTSMKNSKNEIFKKVVSFDQTNLLGKNTYPTVLLWGQEDSSVPIRIARELNDKYPNSVLKILPKCGHNIHLENPNLFYGTLKQILADYF